LYVVVAIAGYHEDDEVREGACLVASTPVMSADGQKSFRICGMVLAATRLPSRLAVIEASLFSTLEVSTWVTRVPLVRFALFIRAAF
jgi:hypothetical protein